MPFHTSRRASQLALSLLVAALAPLGCAGDGAPLEEEVSEARQALVTHGLFMTHDGGIWERGAIGPGTGNDWSYAGEASNVTAMAIHQNELYVTSNDRLWKRGAIGPGTGNDWSYAGDAYGVTAMASFDGSLYVTSNNTLWKRGAMGLGTGNDWIYAGEAYNVVGLAAYGGSLYAVSNDRLWKRGAIGPGTGNDWTYAGEAYNVTGMTTYDGSLYVTSNDNLWKRGAIGPGTGNDWIYAGEAYGVTSLAGTPVDVVRKFAPRLRFDGAAPNYPTSADLFFWQTVQLGNGVVDNTDYAVVASNQIPTYYQVTACGNQIRIMYWWFYGYQHPCFGSEGAHNGDWENVMVTLSEDQSRVAAVTFYAHGDRYTRLAARGGFETEDGTHPVVYVGKLAHGSYHNQGGSGTCGFWEDYRNNFNESHMDSWNNLVNLDGDAETWLAHDRTWDFEWGYDGVTTHPTRSGPSCEMNACDWTTAGVAGAQRYTQCKPGDDDTGVECIDECRSGYTNMGLTCTDWDDWGWPTYTRARYGYDYHIPTSDSGLLYSDG